MKELTKPFDYCLGDFWNKYHYLIILLMGGLLFDTLSTIHFMIHDGIYLEMHPLVKFSAILLGPVAGPILSVLVYKSAALFFLVGYLPRLRFWLLVTPTTTSILAGFYNFG